MDKIELDLNNPIFAMYINVQGLSRQRANELIDITQKSFDVYSNVTFWILARADSGGGETKIECVYDGGYTKRSKELINLIEEINKRIEILSSSSSHEEFKMNIRDWKLGDLFEDGTEEN